MAHFNGGMPSFGDDDDVFSVGPGTRSNGDGGVISDSNGLSAPSSADSMRAYLQGLLDSKEKQLQQAGALGQRVLAQQMELEERVRQLQEIDSGREAHDEPSAEMRLRYRDLSKTVKIWNDENAKLSAVFSGMQEGEPAQQMPPLPLPDVAQDQPSHGPSAPSASQSRRAKNAAHRANDVEFAFEIGSSLLTEVRRLQSLLAERDKAIQNMKEEKDDLEKAVEALRTALRQQEQNADKFKEENWNLEVSLQELRVQLTDAQAAAQRGEAETKRLTKVLATARESNDSSKNEVDRLQRLVEETKNKHETDVALHRKHAAALTRDKSDLQQTVDTYKAELDRASRRLPRFGSPFTPDGRSEVQTPRLPEDDDDPFGPSTTGMSTSRRRLDTSALFPPDAFGPEYVDASPDASPSRPFLSPSHPSNEIEALHQKLAHAQRQISTLKGTLGREKELRIEYRRRLSEAGVKGERLDEDEASEEEADEVAPQPVPRTRNIMLRGRGRGRGRGVVAARSGGRTLAQRLMAAQSVGDDNDEEDVPESSDTYSSTVLPDSASYSRTPDARTRSVEIASPLSPTSPSSPSPEPPSNRASLVSVEGMDPEFANILRRVPSVNRRASPLIRGISRGGRKVGTRRRGGTAFQEPRPSSLVAAPEALAAELGFGNVSIGMDSVREDDNDESQKETKEVACQTDSEKPITAIIKPETSEASIQAEPWPIPNVFRPEMTEIGIQSEGVPERVLVKPELAEMATQTTLIPEAVELPLSVIETPQPVRVNSSIQTIESPRASVSVSTESPRVPVLSNQSTNTDEPEAVPTSEIDVQTDPVPEPESTIREVFIRPETPKPSVRSEAKIQTSPVMEAFPYSSHNLPPSPLAQRRLRYLSIASTATAMPVVHDEDEDAHTELGFTGAHEPETETNTDYQDARSAAATPSASESLNDDDFHSMSTMTDNEFSDDDETGDEDVESIKAAVPNYVEHVSRASSSHNYEEEVPTPLSVFYESAGIETDPPEPKPERELSEISIQTDEWQPAALVPQASSGLGLYRVGPVSQQFQFVSPAASTPVTTVTSPSSHFLSTPFIQSPRDAASTVAARPLRFSSPSLPIEAEKRKSSEELSDIAQRQHTQSLSTMSPSVDKSRPPTMMLPPPPKMPPPPNSMPPPSFIPEKRRPASALSSHRDMPPPRPSSPPPPELIQRATTPIGSVLAVPNRGMSSVRSGLPMTSVLRQPTSTNSFRSMPNTTAQAQMSSESSNAPLIDRRLRSAASLLSDQDDMLSRRSSISSDFHHHRVMSEDLAGTTILNTPGTQSRVANMPSASTDPAIIHAITQTMIGEFLYKYTRRAIGKGHGERRHKRFFWVHPYTKTLYWSSGDPGSTNVTEQSANCGIGRWTCV